jgi:hypothetical protein
LIFCVIRIVINTYICQSYVITACDLISSIVVIGFIVFLYAQVSRFEQRAGRIVAAKDYAVYVRGLPKNATLVCRCLGASFFLN